MTKCPPVVHESASVELGARFADALMAASTWHRDQRRKGSRVPYLGHLLAVAAYIIDAGGSEEAAIAALLHDAIEDQPQRSGGKAGLEKRFGKVVASIVAECSDSDPVGGVERSPENWIARKRAYIADLDHKSRDALLVSLADKLHNATSILADLRGHNSEDVWERFNAGKQEQLEYYHELARRFHSLMPGPMADELNRVVAEIVREA